MDKVREEFECWIKKTMDIDCSEMVYAKLDGDTEYQYHDNRDINGALVVSAMFVAWKASRTGLFITLPKTPDFSASDEPDLAFEHGVDVMKDLIETIGVTVYDQP